MLGSDACSRELIQKALAGDAGSLERLTALARVRVYSYLHRITLDEHEAEDLTQDTLVAMLKSLGSFAHIDRFWAWVFAIATNSARQHYRSKAVRRTAQMASLDDVPTQPPSKSGGDGLNSLAHKELGELTRRAMSQLKERDRMVLALRFYEEMSHAQVAGVLGCSEVTARVSFLRAKHALKRALEGLGIGSSAMLGALAAFGQLTLPPSASAATVTVNSAAVSETTVRGLLSAKAKVVLVAAAFLLVLTGYWNWTSTGIALPTPSQVRFVHFVQQSMSNEISEGDFSGSRSKGAYEQWYHFPEGTGGPLFMRIQRWNPRQTERLCWWVQDEDANYYVHSGEQRVYVSNARLTSSSGTTRVLPTDPPEFCEFIRQIEGEKSQAMVDGDGITYQRDPATGLPTTRLDIRFQDLGEFVTRYDYGRQEMTLFDAPTGLPITDERDEMHQRGWTCFRVQGRLRNLNIEGTGHLPFVYSAAQTHPAWMRLTVEGKPLAVDNGQRAAIIDHGTGQVTCCRGGSLFAGFSSPWIGLHTLDSVRRFAARHRMWFSTELLEEKSEGRVTVIDRSSPTHLMARYFIDMENDLLKEVQYWAGPGGAFEERLGELRFSYLPQTPDTETEFSAPTASELAAAGSVQEPQPLWPVQVMVPPAPARPGRRTTEPSCPVALR